MSKKKKMSKKPKARKQLVLGSSLGIILAFLIAGTFWFQSPFDTSRLEPEQVEASTQPATAINVSINDLANAVASEPAEDYVIVDVREQWEYDAGHVPGVMLIPLGELQARVSELPDDKALYVICQSGVRSRRASDMLLEAGKQDIRNVEGGTAAWARAGLPIEQGQ